MAVINICDNYSEDLATSFIKLAISQHRMMRTDLCLYFFGLPFSQFLHLCQKGLDFQHRNLSEHINLKLRIMTFGTFLLYALGAIILLPIIINLIQLFIAMIISLFCNNKD